MGWAARSNKPNKRLNTNNQIKNKAKHTKKKDQVKLTLFGAFKTTRSKHQLLPSKTNRTKLEGVAEMKKKAESLF